MIPDVLHLFLYFTSYYVMPHFVQEVLFCHVESRADLLRLADFLKIIRGNLDKMDESSKPKDSNKLRSEIDGFLGRVEALGG